MKKLFIYTVMTANTVLWFLVASFGCVERPGSWGVTMLCAVLSALSLVAGFLVFETKFEESRRDKW